MLLRIILFHSTLRQDWALSDLVQYEQAGRQDIPGDSSTSALFTRLFVMNSRTSVLVRFSFWLGFKRWRIGSAG